MAKVTPDQVVAALRKDPSLAWATHIALQKAKIAGPWEQVGEGWFRGCIPGEMISRVASIGSRNQDGLHHWSTTTHADVRAGKGAGNKGTAASVQWAKDQIDKILVEEGYTLVPREAKP